MKLGIKFLLAATVTIWAAVASLPDGKLHVVFCSVGEGDATLIYKGTTQILIDGGPDDKVIDCLAKYMPFYDRRIEAVILTHDQADHRTGLKFVAQRYTVLQFEPKLRKGQKLVTGGIVFEVLSPDGRVLGTDTTGKENDEGIVGVVRYGDFDALLTADVQTELYPAEDGLEVVKVPHHGSKTDWDPTWWGLADPLLAVISVGKNSYGHPTQEVIKTLSDEGIKFLRTDQEGDIEIVSDGKSWEVK
jgi:competence protein ComEC